MAEPESKRTCSNCGAVAPSTQTEYTLIGGKYAWRCKKTLAAGAAQATLAWYCPSCWKNVRPESRK